MIESKEELIKKVSEILSKKSFTEKAKDNLLRSIVFIFESYSPPLYVQCTRSEYIMKYLGVLENMKGYAVIELSEINDPNEISTQFRKEIVRSTNQSGNLNLVDGKYVPAPNGEFYCSCKGIAWRGEQMMFSLGENKIGEELITVHHEMTHLTEGKNAFPINTSIPFSFELRKMFYEGRAVTHESYVSNNLSNVQVDSLEDGGFEYQIVSNCSYPLYGNLYQTLQIIFDNQILEEMGKNDIPKADMIKELEERYPNIPVQEVFAHLIYILSCKSKESKDVLANAIHYYARSHAKKIEQKTEILEFYLKSKQDNESYLKNLKVQEQNYMQLLGNEMFLKQEYEKAYQEILIDIEELYKNGTYTEEEYCQELESVKREGTLEYYREVKKQELQDNRSEQERVSKDIIRLEADIKKIEFEKKESQQNQFPLVLERVCLKKPSLQTSFTFLENLAILKVQSEKNAVSEGDTKISILLDKIRILLELKEKTIVVSEEKKASLVS